MRQREISGVSAKIDAISGRLDIDRDGGGRGQASRLFDPEEVRSALAALEENQGYGGQQTQRDAAVINSRARQALNAYAAQQNLARDDVQSSLRQLLGVDYYA
ncbi:MAG: hypothetical protein H6R26_646 [Proteobacteria bacterium]|nr:hypothetical protein [Pseudomonadota bacterium]